MAGPGPAAARARLWELLGTRPPAAVTAARRLGVDESGPVAIERWVLALDAGEPVPALLTRPVQGEARGLVVYHHAHGHRFETGKDELLHGRPALQQPAYGPALARRGWAALAIDHRGFGERRHTPERALFKRALWEGATLLGLRIADAVAATGWARSDLRFAGRPLAAFGFSMGSTIAWWSAALDPRVDAVVEMCCLSEFGPLLDSGGYDLHAEYFFVPGLLREFTAASINALIAPRPHLSLAGRDDPLTPPAGLEAIDRELREACARAGAPRAWRQSVHPTGHGETPAMRAEVLAFLDGLAR
jgi:dienelactone hydrolase